MAVDPAPNEVDPQMWAALPRKRVAAGVVLLDERGRLLLVEPTYKPGWEVPGGMVEPGEAPRAGARREVREELGVDVEVGRLLVVDWVPPGRRPDDGLVLLYAGGAVDPRRFALEADEIASWAFCDDTGVEQRTTPFMARRLRAALRALAEGRTVELEDGRPVG